MHQNVYSDQYEYSKRPFEMHVSAKFFCKCLTL
jgi:hypothetical protein